MQLVSGEQSRILVRKEVIRSLSPMGQRKKKTTDYHLWNMQIQIEIN